jgi:hypothetical protein
MPRLRSILLGIHWLLLPASLYGIFLLIVAIIYGKPVNALIIFIFFVFVKLSLVYFFNRRIIRPGEKLYGLVRDLNISRVGKWSLTGFLIIHLILKRTLAFFLTKLLSFLSLYVFLVLIPTVDYMDRFVGIAIFITVLSNSLIPYEMFHFFFRKMIFFRNLPIRRSFIYIQLWLTSLILLSPEVIFLFRNFMIFKGPVFLTIHVLAGFSLLFSLFGWLLIFDMDQKKFINLIFWVLVIIVFYLLFDLPAIILLIIFLVSSYSIYYLYFYRYEPVYEHQAGIK